MLSRGYSATGVDDICRDSGVSKGSFYHQFSSKEELAIAALDNFYEAGLEKLLAIDLSSTPPDKRLFAFLDAVAEQGHEFWKNGCLIGSLASEMALASVTLQTKVSRLFNETIKVLEPMIEPFAASLLDKTLTATAIAEHFLVVVEGAIVMARAHDDPTKINQAVARFAAQLRWLPRKQTGRAQQPATQPAKKRTKQ